MINIQPGAPSATIDTPIEHLDACHRRIEARLQSLERIATAWPANPAEARAAILTVFRFFDTSGVHHTADEEESFFPRLSGRLDPGEAQFLDVLSHEHERAEGLYKELKVLIATEPIDEARLAALISGFTSLYREHIRQEDSRFPAIARRYLSGPELDAIAAEMKHRRGL